MQQADKPLLQLAALLGKLVVVVVVVVVVVLIIIIIIIKFI